MKKKIKKKILLMIGSDLRNNYICSEIMKKYFIDGIVYQYRSKKLNNCLKLNQKRRRNYL